MLLQQTPRTQNPSFFKRAFIFHITCENKVNFRGFIFSLTLAPLTEVLEGRAGSFCIFFSLKGFYWAGNLYNSRSERKHVCSEFSIPFINRVHIITFFTMMDVK
jgi:hypothetical protein